MKVGALIVSLGTNTNKISALLKTGDIPTITRMVLTFKRAGVERSILPPTRRNTLKKKSPSWG